MPSAGAERLRVPLAPESAEESARRAEAVRASWRAASSWRRGGALAALTLLLTISPSATVDLRAERYCFDVGDGVCDEGPRGEAPCAVGRSRSSSRWTGCGPMRSLVRRRRTSTR